MTNVYVCPECDITFTTRKKLTSCLKCGALLEDLTKENETDEL